MILFKNSDALYVLQKRDGYKIWKTTNLIFTEDKAENVRKNIIRRNKGESYRVTLNPYRSDKL